MFAQLVFDLGRVSDQIELVDLFVIAQRHNGAGNEVRRAKITAHRVEGDLHRCESLRTKAIDCKAKFVAASLREAWLECTSPTGRRLQFSCLPTSTPVARGNSRRMGRRCAMARCSRTVDIC